MSLPASSLPEHLTRVGYLLGPHGVSGSIKLYVLGSAQQLSKLKRFYIEGLGWTRVVKFEMHGVGPALLLGGITDRNAAQDLRGRQVYAHDAELPKLPEGEYYYHELRGLPLKDASGAVLGQVTDVQDAGHQDLLVIGSDTGSGLQGLIPLQAPYVLVQRGQAIVLTEDAPDGLLSIKDDLEEAPDLLLDE